MLAVKLLVRTLLLLLTRLGIKLLVRRSITLLAKPVLRLIGLLVQALELLVKLLLRQCMALPVKGSLKDPCLSKLLTK